jgi:hypothetical protein
MVTVKDYGLGKNLKKLEKENLPSKDDIEKENSELLEKEAEFKKKFLRKKHVR